MKKIGHLLIFKQVNSACCYTVHVLPSALYKIPVCTQNLSKRIGINLQIKTFIYNRERLILIHVSNINNKHVQCIHKQNSNDGKTWRNFVFEIIHRPMDVKRDAKR